MVLENTKVPSGRSWHLCLELLNWLSGPFDARDEPKTMGLVRVMCHGYRF